ncbi:MAG TPA: ribbon-helix-helix domain-containing protein [Casimicrobiaceae bacterium]|nr:ribbon-helix-helix domain-containing protein [Casimicrobiaceae bacterium]
MSIYIERNDLLAHMFDACTTSQINEFIPEKRGFRIHGHSTTIALERAYWNVLEDMARETGVTLPRLIERIHDSCLIANDKNIASCLRVICLKYLNIYAGGAAADAPAQRAAAATATLRS